MDAAVQRQATSVDRAARERAQGHRGVLIWLTGRPSAGKSSIADRLEVRLHALGLRTYLLDGDNLRQGLNNDLGFSAADRVENIRRAGEVGLLLVEAGVIVIAAFVSPFTAERRRLRERFAAGSFVEVFVDAPLAVAEARDPKGHYARARRGELPDFTGIDSPYEAPESPEVHLDTARLSADEACARLFAELERRGHFAPV